MFWLDCVDVDMEATTSMQTTLASQGETLMELEVSHSNGTNGIQSEADSCLKKEYMVCNLVVVRDVYLQKLYTTVNSYIPPICMYFRKMSQQD